MIGLFFLTKKQNKNKCMSFTVKIYSLQLKIPSKLPCVCVFMSKMAPQAYNEAQSTARITQLFPLLCGASLIWGVSCRPSCARRLSLLYNTLTLTTLLGTPLHLLIYAIFLFFFFPPQESLILRNTQTSLSGTDIRATNKITETTFFPPFSGLTWTLTEALDLYLHDFMHRIAAIAS